MVIDILIFVNIFLTMPTFTPTPIGCRYGKLIILGDAERSFCGARMWKWKCDCGSKGSSQMCAIKNGATKSCGCYARSIDRKVPGSRGSNPLYLVWRTMHDRCNLPSVKAYKHYGGRGISVCDRWNNFDIFVKDMGPRPEGGTLDRKDNNGNYEPSNCRWATHKEQMNNMRKNVLIPVNGEMLTIAQASERFFIPYPRLYARIKKGWPVQKAISLSYHQRHKFHAVP